MKRQKQKKSSNILYMLKIIWKGCPQRIVLTVVERVVGAGFQVFFGIYFMRTLINSIQSGKSFGTVMILVLFAAILSCLANFFYNFVYNYYVNVTNEIIIQHFSKLTYEAAMSADYACFENPEFYDNYTKATAEINTRGIKLLSSSSSIIGSLISLTVNVCFLVYYDVLLIPVMFLPAIITYIIDRFYNKAKFDFDMKRIPAKRKLDYVKRTVYLKDFSKEMRLSNIFKIMFSRFHQSVDELIQVAKTESPKVARLRFFREIVFNWLMGAGVFAFIIFRFISVDANMLGNLAALLSMSSITTYAIRRLMQSSISIYENVFYIDNLRNFMEYKPKIVNTAQSISVPKEIYELSADNVSFTYEGSSKPVIKNFSFNIKAGEKIAIVGHNGAGKSTLVKLLLRLYDVTEGTICINGHNIKDYKLEEYRASFATVFQDFQIFGMTVAENVLQREIESPEDYEEAETALSQSGLLEKVMSFKFGMDTQMTREFDPEGEVMSGGEFQKLAIARVFAQGSPIAILDEPSSALDPISEYKIFESMMEACKDKTVIFISHRLSSSVLADRIYMLEEGEVIECGSHKELMTLNGKYAEMFRMQAEKYIDSEVMAYEV